MSLWFNPNWGALQGPPTPQMLGAEGELPAVLAFHGFGGTPLEVSKVVEASTVVGLRSYAPLLPGHGSHARELARCRFEDWLGAARLALVETSLSEPVILAGFSLGSLLAIHLTLEQPQRVKALILMANALWLKAPWPRWALKFAHAFHCPDLLIPKPNSDLGDPKSHIHHATYSAQPLHSAIEVLCAGEALRSRLKGVKCPSLLLHGALDRVCPVSNAWRTAERIGSNDVKVVILPRSHHVLNWDFDAEQVRAELVSFLSRQSLKRG